MKGLQKDYNYIISHHYISIKMTLLVKLAVISKIGEEASLLGKSACLSSSSLQSSRKIAYLVSTSSYI